MGEEQEGNESDYETVQTPMVGGARASKCKECGYPGLTECENGELVCQNCGLVQNERIIISTAPEWGAISRGDQGGGRVGLPTSYSMHDKGLATIIGRPTRDGSGKALSVDAQRDVANLQKWQGRSRTHTSADRNLAQAMNDIARFCDALHISAGVKEEAAVIYRKALDKGVVRGRSIAAIAAASVYAGCRRSGIPRTLKEVAEVSRIRKKDVGRCHRYLVIALDLELPLEDPVKCVAKIANKVNAGMATQRRTIELINAAKQNGIVAGKDPMGLAAAAMYIASVLEKEPKTQDEIARSANMTEVTVRNRYKELENALGITL